MVQRAECCPIQTKTYENIKRQAITMAGEPVGTFDLTLSIYILISFSSFSKEIYNFKVSVHRHEVFSLEKIVEVLNFTVSAPGIKKNDETFST